MLRERRRAFRVPVSGKALLETSRAVVGPYRVNDVSMTGCMVEGTAAHELGEELDVQLLLDGSDERRLRARVVRHLRVARAHRLGLAFLQPDPAFEDRMQDLVMRRLEHGQQSEVLLVHANPERVQPLLEAMLSVGHRLMSARTAREAMSFLGDARQRVRVAFVAPIVGASRARDIVKLISRKAPSVQCVLLSRGGAKRLGRAIREAAATERGFGLARLRSLVTEHGGSLGTLS